MPNRTSVPVDGDWVWELPPDDGVPTSLDCLARGEVCVREGAYVEALRQFGVALALEPDMPRAQLGAALALDGIGATQRAREMLSVDGLAERLGIQSLLSGLELAANRGWGPEAVAFVVQAYRLRPSWRDVAALDELATRALDSLFPEVASALPPEARPTRGLRAGRNDPCPCGSGKKYKRCHLKADQEAARGPAVRGEADNLYIVAFVHERSREWDAAAALWGYLAERFPESALFLIRLGSTRLKLGQVPPALAAFERLDRFPVSLWEDAVVERARCLHELGRHREALRCLDSRPKVAIRSGDALVLRSAILGHLGRLSEARDELLRAHRLEPGRADTLVQLAEAHQLLADFQAAGEAALAALTLSAVPDGSTSAAERLDLRLSAAAILAGLGWESQMVLDVCSEVVESGAEADVRIQALSVRAYALLTLSQPSETAAAVEQALKIGENVELYLLGAASASQLGDSQARITYLREGVRCLEEDQEADADELAVGGLIAATLGLFDRALPLADRALAADPESAVAVPVRAHCLLRLDRAPQALAFTDARHTAEVSSPLLVLTRAESLVRLGRYEDALVELNGPLPLDTGPLAPLLRQLQEVQPEERRDLLRARALRELGREGESREILSSLTTRNPTYGEAWQELAQLRLSLGETVDAHRALLRADHLDPSNSVVRERLAYVEGMLRVAQAERAEAEALVIRNIGRKAWLTLGESSRLALVASEVIWRQLRGVEGPSDFGSEVGQIARAVELELQRRLFSPFREYTLRTLGREGLQRIAAEETSSIMLPFYRFVRAPQGGLSLGPMLAVADSLIAVEPTGPALGLLRRYVEVAYASPAKVRELLADPELAVLNSTRNQGLHRETVGLDAASRCRAFAFGGAPGKGWLTAMTQLLVPRMVDQSIGRALLGAIAEVT